MKNWSKFVILGAVLAATTSFAFADGIDLSGPGTFSGGIYTPGPSSPPTSVFNVTSASGMFTSFVNQTPVFYTFNDTSTPTGKLFSVENLGGTEDLTFVAASEAILDPLQILFTGELYENGVALTAATMGFSENPLNTSGTEDTINIAATPEPASLLLLGTGLLGVAGIARRKFAAKFV